MGRKPKQRQEQEITIQEPINNLAQEPLSIHEIEAKLNKISALLRDDVKSAEIVSLTNKKDILFRICQELHSMLTKSIALLELKKIEVQFTNEARSKINKIQNEIKP